MTLEDVDLTDLDRFVDGFPHDVFTVLRRTAPVFWHEPTAHTPDDEGFWVLSRHADVLAAGADGETFSSEGGGDRAGGGTILEDLPAGFAAGVLLNMMDDPRHQRIRKLLTPAVGARGLARMEPELRRRAEVIVASALERGRVDFVTDVAAELPLQAIAGLLGVPQEDRHRLFGWANTTLDYDDRDLGEESARTQRASAEMLEYGRCLVEARRDRPGNDLLSRLAGARVDGPDGTPAPLTDLELQMFFNLLIAAGSETTRNSITVGLLALRDHPEQWDAVREDRALLPGAVEEMLRWASSTPYNRRTATTDVVVGGRTIRAGAKVTLWWASANRDEQVFDQPFRFDVRRDPNRHLAFGHGSHFCLGAALARLEMRLVFDVLLDRVTAVEPTGAVEWTRSNKHTGVRHLPVELLPR